MDTELGQVSLRVLLNLVHNRSTQFKKEAGKISKLEVSNASDSKANSKGTISIIFGALSIVTSFMAVGFILGIIGLIYGVIGVRQINRFKQNGKK
ncbi:hypothetical protein CV093_14835 [Oceanobacillus sp. 143]|nr:hypothetical protein CV093_14835 [Oceanobacillus sp. 143]